MADDPDTTDADASEAHEEIEIQFSDFHDGSLAEAERAAVMTHLASCEACKLAYEDFKQTLAALGAFGKGQRAPVPEAFGKGVEETIAARSAGRFFGKKSLGDRLPFGIILVVALIVLITIAAVLWSSETGTLRYRKDTRPPTLAPGARDAVPTP